MRGNMHNLELEKNNQMVEGIVSAILVLLILFGTHSSIFSVCAFVLITYIVIMMKPEFALKQMIFILPLANIFKLAPGSQSFYTFVVLLYVARCIVRSKKVVSALMLFVFYIMIMQILNGSISVTRTMKFVSGLLMLYYVMAEIDIEKTHAPIFKRYILGVIIASSIARIDSNFFSISRYLSVQELGIRYGYGEMTRFTGLDTDPNYYALSIIISLCLIVFMYHRSEIKAIPAVIQVALLLSFALLTYSKSVLLMLIFPVIYLAISNHKRGNYVLQIILIICVVGVVLYALAGNIQAINIIITRMTVNTNLNGLTTGRIELWEAYLNYFDKHIIKSIFGFGLGAGYAPNVNRAVHNSYIESVYHLGVLGFLWLVYILRKCSRINRNRDILNYSVLICIMIMYLFLNELFYYDAPFHFLLAFIVMNCENEEELQLDSCFLRKD